jgi:membrane fusion protein, multidrug efflux system
VILLHQILNEPLAFILGSLNIAFALGAYDCRRRHLVEISDRIRLSLLMSSLYLHIGNWKNIGFSFFVSERIRHRYVAKVFVVTLGSVEMSLFLPEYNCHTLIHRALFIVVLGASLSACSKTSGVANQSDHTDTVVSTGTAPDSKSSIDVSLLVSPEDIVTVTNNSLTSSPSITGSVQPEQRADLRAEVAAVVLQVLKENGDAVRRGDLLVRLDGTAIRDSLNSAEASEHASTQAYEQAERQLQRLSKLREAGVVSMQALEDAGVQRNNAQSDLQAAKSRTAQARQQLQRTEVRAPFDGIICDRKVSAGDTAQIGKELVKVIDPHSMRFEGMVSADNIGTVKTGQEVLFRVHGYADQDFIGKVTRVNPAANITTRQVEVLVNFANAEQLPKLAGLYAEGRIETSSTANLTVPASALVKEGAQVFAWRLSNNKLRKVSLAVGARDMRSGEFALKSGLAAGDTLLRHPSGTLIDGQRVEWTSLN